MREKRRYQRLPTRGFMDCAVDFSLNDRRYTNIPVLSLSAGGAYIAIETDRDNLTKGDRLCGIRFSIEILNGMLMDGIIVHKMSLGEVGGCGIEFCDVPTLTRESLDTFVHHKLKEFGLD
ncbi:PilZ domain-containing protein [Sulfidibacter corallicola]|uniref:PilZ domain-containing protein n=1 Tax=Sulfidibacter corallicola TaxID=2818388 RepID=A0A8A4TR05_SULCO|nr:PilZ domain-containing protein [Sulfidibacter corallicola]QTD51953.1 PilZ domain-containing protein [Sulfidibacter corallicola]